MASTAPRITVSREKLRGRKVTIPQNTTVYSGTMVVINGAVAGVYMDNETIVNGAGVTKDTVVFEGEFQFLAPGLTKANEGDLAYAVDNDTVTATEGDNLAGRIQEVITENGVVTAFTRIGLEFQV